jgi:hypothetical protein
LRKTIFACLLTAFLATAGTATAAKLITGRDVANNSLTGTDIKNNTVKGKEITGVRGGDIRNGSIRMRDLSSGVRRLIARSRRRGPQGPAGPAGPTGPQGPQGPAGTTAVYSANGTQQNNTHIVTGSGTTNAQNGNLGVALQGSAVFTSSTSYVCNATYATSQAVTSADLTVSNQNGSNFTVKGANGAAVQFICVGN